MQHLVRSLLLLGLAGASSFRYGTINWEHAGDNLVRFELVTAWRRSFEWPKHENMVGFGGVDGRPIVGDKIRLVGLDPSNSPLEKRFPNEFTGVTPTGARGASSDGSSWSGSWTSDATARDHAAKTGLSDRLGNLDKNFPRPALGNDGTYKNYGEVHFSFGDGEYCYIDATVTAYSVKEDWIMTMSRIQHKYPGPWKSRSRKFVDGEGVIVYEAGNPNRQYGKTGDRSEPLLGAKPAWDANYPKSANTGLKENHQEEDGHWVSESSGNYKMSGNSGVAYGSPLPGGGYSGLPSNHPIEKTQGLRTSGYSPDNTGRISRISNGNAMAPETRGTCSNGAEAHGAPLGGVCYEYEGNACCSAGQASQAGLNGNCPMWVGECARLAYQFSCASACRPNFPNQGGSRAFCRGSLDRLFDACENQLFSFNAGDPILGAIGKGAGCYTLKDAYGDSDKMASAFTTAGHTVVNSNPVVGSENCFGLTELERLYSTRAEGLSTLTNPTRRSYPEGLDSANQWTQGGGASVSEAQQTHDDDAMLQINQPYSYEPWVASFTGCCRIRGLENNPDMPWLIKSELLLSPVVPGYVKDSPVVRTLPTITVADDQGETTVWGEFYIPSSWDNERQNNHPSNAKQSWSKAPSMLNFYKAPDFSVDANTGKVNFKSEAQGFYNMLVTVAHGASSTQVDLLVRNVPYAENNKQPMVMSPPTPDQDFPVECFVGAGCTFDIQAKDGDTAQSLVFNYVFMSLSPTSTHKGSSIHSIESGANNNEYSPSNGAPTQEGMYSQGDPDFERDFNGLPIGATLTSNHDGAITDIALSLSNPFEHHRPLHEATYSKSHMEKSHERDLWHNDLDKLAADGFEQVPGNLNHGSGGASVHIWIKRDDDQPAITEIFVTADKNFEGHLKLAGYSALPQDLNFQSESNLKMHMWFKRGSGPAIMSIAAAHSAGAKTELAASGYMAVKEYWEWPVTTNESINEQGEEVTEGSPVEVFFKKNIQNPITRTFNWVPCFHDEGRYVFCFEATDDYTSSNALAPEVRSSSTQHCITINVAPDPVPEFTQPSLAAGEFFVGYMGDTLVFDVCARDRAWPGDSIVIAHQGSLPSGRHEIAENYGGDDGAGSKAAGYEYNWRLSRNNQAVTTYGARLSPQERYVDSEESSNQWCRVFEWTPTPEMGGWSNDICFTATDEAGSCHQPDTTVHCVSIQIAKCVWSIQVGESLVEVAARFNTNWLQLWHLNVQMQHPDMMYHEDQNQALAVGHLYTAEWDDNLYELADRFGSTVQHIRNMNADIGADNEIQEGKQLCITPNSCHTFDDVQRLWLGPDTAAGCPGRVDC